MSEPWTMPEWMRPLCRDGAKIFDDEAVVVAAMMDSTTQDHPPDWELNVALQVRLVERLHDAGILREPQNDLLARRLLELRTEVEVATKAWDSAVTQLGIVQAAVPMLLHIAEKGDMGIAEQMQHKRQMDQVRAGHVACARARERLMMAHMRLDALEARDGG